MAPTNWHLKHFKYIFKKETGLTFNSFRLAESDDDFLYFGKCLVFALRISLGIRIYLIKNYTTVFKFEVREWLYSSFANLKLFGFDF